MKNGEKKPYKTIKSINKQDEMRDRAEDFIYNGPVKAVDGTDSVSLNEIKQNIHELRVHQIELQMQNEEILEAERKPGNSNSRYFNLYNLAPMGYCTVSEKGIILEANLTMKKMLGTEEKTMIKRRFSTYILKEDNDIYYLFRKKSIETDNLQTCELRMVKNDKKIFWVSLQLKALRDEDGTDSFFVAISDFSKHKQMETDLRESRAIFSNAFEFSAIGMALVSPDGHWLKVNQNVCHLLEYSESELLNMTFQDITCLDDLAPYIEYA